MVFGLNLPKIFNRRNKRIKDLLEEAENISQRELDSEEILATLYKTFFDFLQESKQAKVQHELGKEYADIEKVEVLRPYFKRMLRLLNKIRRIIEILRKFNKQALYNVQELRQLVIERNSRLLSRLPTRQNKIFLGFLQICDDRFREKRTLDNLLANVAINIGNMVKLAEKGIEDVNVFDNHDVLEILNMEQQLFVQSVKSELQELGIDAQSLEDVESMKELNEYIFDKEFLNKSTEARKALKRNITRKRVAMALLTMHLGGFQIVLPTYFAALESKGASLQMHYPAIYQQLQQDIEEIQFKTPDNLELSGVLVHNKHKEPTNKVMIFVHGRNVNATFLLPYVKYLRQTTDNVDFLAINLRGHGPDTPKGWFTETALVKNSTMGLKESLDVVGAINYLADLGYKEVVVYGHSVGGAAVLHAIGQHKDMISSEIEVKGVIVEKTFANVKEFLNRLYNSWMSNFGFNAYRGIKGTEYPTINFGGPTRVQWEISKSSVEAIGGYRLEENKPSESAKHINVPLLAIGNKGGDAMMKEEDMRKIAENGHGTVLIVESEYNNLSDKHKAEFDNPQVLSAINNFVKSIM